MSPASAAFALFVMALSLARIVLGIWLMAAPLPLRDGARLRVPCALLGLFITYLVLFVATLVPLAGRSGLGFSLAQLATFSLLLAACVGATLAVYDTSVWTALFCCSAGYTVQNLASGATEFIWTLSGGGSPGDASFYTPMRFAISFACMVVVYALTYLLVTRHLRHDGLERIEDRRMLLMFVLTILVIIGFDLLVKWLVEQGVAMGAMVLLRLFHGLACAFTLTMEFELLVRRRVEAERDTLTQVLAEHERQYEQARGSVAAINARVHDIRHSVARLADGEGLGREAIRELVREVNVYDSTVRTGNEALDTALTEQRLRFERAGVALPCVADGSALAFMAPADTYALFSTVLDAMLEAGPTSASLVVRRALGTTSVHLECTGATLTDTSLRTAREIVARYQGSLTTLERDGSFHVNALFAGRA